MDAEGAEWSILPDLVEHGLLCKNRVGKVYIELHTPARGFQIDEAYRSLCSDCETSLAGIRSLVEKQNCGTAGFTTFVEMDDESFADDARPGEGKWTIPLPTPRSQARSSQTSASALSDQPIGSNSIGGWKASYKKSSSSAQEQEESADVVSVASTVVAKRPATAVSALQGNGPSGVPEGTPAAVSGKDGTPAPTTTESTSGTPGGTPAAVSGKDGTPAPTTTESTSGTPGGTPAAVSGENGTPAPTTTESTSGTPGGTPGAVSGENGTPAPTTTQGRVKIPTKIRNKVDMQMALPAEATSELLMANPAFTGSLQRAFASAVSGSIGLTIGKDAISIDGLVVSAIPGGKEKNMQVGGLGNNRSAV